MYKEEILKRFRYDPVSGKVHTLERSPEKNPPMNQKWCDWFNKEKAGKEVGYKDSDGYLLVDFYVKGKRITRHVHRIGWLLYFGDWPEKQVDHINGLRADNRISNLRELGHKQNHKNKNTYSPVDNSGGVFYNSEAGRWVVYTVTRKGHKRHLEDFKTEAEAWDWLQAYQKFSTNINKTGN